MSADDPKRVVIKGEFRGNYIYGYADGSVEIKPGEEHQEEFLKHLVPRHIKFFCHIAISAKTKK